MNQKETAFSKTGARFVGRVKFLPNMGEIIAKESPGKGFASYPWVLDSYERALGVTPEEVWLLHRMIKHVWEADGCAFVSMRKASDEALISRTRLDKIVKALLKKGYITVIGRGISVYDRRIRYDISGVYNALMIAISCNPTSKYAQENGCRSINSWFQAPSEQWSDFTTPAQINDWLNTRGQRYNWAEGKVEPLETDYNGHVYKATCEECEEVFSSGSPNAKHCPACRNAIRKERWHAFRNAFSEYEQVIQEEED